MLFPSKFLEKVKHRLAMEIAAVFFGQIEREMLSADIYSIWQNPQLPDHLLLHINQELEKQDIWKSQSQDSQTTPQQSKKLTIAKKNSV